MKSKTNHFPAPQIDIRNFRLKRINEPEYRHMWLLLFWPIFGLRYLLIENLDPAGAYHLIHCPLDDRIPFQELFLIPYALWYVCIIGMHLYTMVYDVAAFKKYTKFLVISITASTAIFILYPSYQELRPAVFPRDNVLTDIVGMIYQIDTNTNIFPSEHAIGAIAVFCVSCHTKGLHSPLKTTLIGILTVLICLSTVFLKQHSILDVAAALPVCMVAYAACYGKEQIRKRQTTAIINAITYVLIAFVAVSLIVSSIMIGVITLISVQERTKEIGVLRAIGASKENVSNLFNAETIIIGFASGTLGVLVTKLLCIPINAILHHFTGISSLNAYLPWQVALVLIGISVVLTMFAGLIPSRSAAKKDPVVALRSE